MKFKTNLINIICALAVFLPSAAFAHPGHDSTAFSLFHYLMHHANNHYGWLLLIAICLYASYKVVKK